MQNWEYQTHIQTLIFVNLIFETLIFVNLIFVNLIFVNLIFETLIFETLIFKALIFKTLIFETLIFETLIFETLIFASKSTTDSAVVLKRLFDVIRIFCVGKRFFVFTRSEQHEVDGQARNCCIRSVSGRAPVVRKSEAFFGSDTGTYRRNLSIKK